MGRPVEILSIRHGRTEHNAQGRFVGVTDSPLDAEGRRQARALHRRLDPVRLDAIVASPLARAWGTARRPGRRVGLLPGLAEMDQGEFEGRLLRDVVVDHAAFFERWRRDPTSLRVPGGETLSEVQARGLSTLRSVAEQCPPGGRVLVVSHQMVLSSVACALDGASLRRWADYRSDHTAGWRLVWTGARLEVVGRVGVAGG